MSNSDKNVVKDFGEEWNQYPQDSIEDAQLLKAYNQYFNIFPFDQLPAQMGETVGGYAGGLVARIS